MKHCTYCHQNKPFEPEAKRGSKASGFMGARCWTCWLKYQRESFQAMPQKTRGGPTLDELASEEVFAVNAIRAMFRNIPDGP